MKAQVYCLLVAVLWLVFDVTTALAQGNSSADTPKYPPHRGTVEGQKGPKASAPPASQAENPLISGDTSNKLTTLRGTVSDSFCTRHHYMLTGASDAECVRYCIAHRGTYVLLAGDKVYSLQNRPGHVLESLAGQTATLTGVLNGNVLEIKSVTPGTNATKGQL